MPVPKRRKSRARRDTRRAHLRAHLPAMGTCNRCHEPKILHTVCPHCGFYGDIEVFKPAAAGKK